MPIHAEELRRYLAETSGKPVRLRINDNLHSLITTSRDGAGPGVRISLHRMFLQADHKVFAALAQFILKPTPEARRVIRSYINKNRTLITEARGLTPPRRITGTPRGQHLDLAARAADINQRYFDGKLKFNIIWGRGTRGRRCQRNVTLGTWNERQGIVRIHPILDNPRVPSFYVDYVIYHEMVHIAVPSHVDSGGRLLHHTPEFYRMERRFEYFTRAQAWEKRWLRTLIRAWHEGEELPSAAAGQA